MTGCDCCINDGYLVQRGRDCRQEHDHDDYLAELAKITRMKTLNERIEDFMAWKQVDRQIAIDTLLIYALDAIDARRKGGKKTGNRPQQEKHLARARKVRQK